MLISSGDVFFLHLTKALFYTIKENKFNKWNVEIINSDFF